MASSSSSSSDKETVRDFMTKANRPFSANDVISGVQRQGVGKSAVEKALNQLVEENQLVLKMNGKQKIYCATQPDSTAEDQRDVQLMDEELLKTDLAFREVERKYKQSEAEVKMIQGTHTVEELKRKLAEVEEMVEALRERKKRLSEAAGGGTAMPEKEKDQVKKDYEKYAKEYKKRKRLCTDVLDSILENCPKTKKVLFEEIGVETDESVDMPSL